MPINEEAFRAKVRKMEEFLQRPLTPAEIRQIRQPLEPSDASGGGQTPEGGDSSAAD